MQTVLIGQSFSIIKRYDYGLESGLIMRKGFLDQSPDKKYEKLWEDKELPYPSTFDDDYKTSEHSGAA